MTRRLVLTPASDVRIRPVRWLWADRLPIGTLCISAGRAGIAKSQHAVWLAAELTRGTLPGIHYCTPRSVIYAATEDSWEMTIAPRLIAAGADMGRIYRVHAHTDGDEHTALTLPVDTALLGQAIRDYDVALLILDPLLSIIDAGVNDYRAREVRTALEPIVAVADQTRCTTLGIAHFTKASGSDPLLLIAGSAGFGQLVRAALGFARDDEAGDYVLSTIKNNLGREDLASLHYTIEEVIVPTDEGPSKVSRFVLGAESDRHVRDVLRERDRGSEDHSDLDEARDWLIMFLTDVAGTGYAPATEVLHAGQAAGFAKHTLQRARKRAGIRTRKADFAGGWVWAVPEDDSQGDEDDQARVQSPSSSSSHLRPDVIDFEAAGRALREQHTGCPKHPCTPTTTDGKCPLCVLDNVTGGIS